MGLTKAELSERARKAWVTRRKKKGKFSGQNRVTFRSKGKGKTRKVIPIMPKVLYHSTSGPPPKHIIDEIKQEMKTNPDRKTASDLEAMAYLSTASLAFPFNEQYTNIYCYLMYQYLEKKGKGMGSLTFLKDHKTLSDYDRQALNRLKAKIFRHQQKDLQARRRESK